MDISLLRKRFPSLSREQAGKDVIYLDGPAGTQVPQTVVDGISEVMLHHNANRHGHFATSLEGDAIMTQAHQAAADWVGCEDPDETIFGANMTTMTFHFSRAIALQWQPGDEVVVTRLDHDANYSPWILAARERGVCVKTVDILPQDATLDIEDFRRQLNPQTRFVAFTCASNSVGSRTPIKQLVTMAHEVGAQVFLDAVHYAPHDRIDVKSWGCDFLVCSAYKFFGPHIGIMWGRRELLEHLEAFKVEPASDEIPERWMTGTQNVACLAGVIEAIDYVASLSCSKSSSRKTRLDASFEWIRSYEKLLVQRLIDGLRGIPEVTIYGITDSSRANDRVPTIAFNIAGYESAAAAKKLASMGIFVWHGNYYALQLSRRLGQEPHGMIRMGMMHYNTPSEVDRTIEAVASMAKSTR